MGKNDKSKEKIVSNSHKPPNHENYDWKIVRPDPDQRSWGEIYNSEIKLNPENDVLLPPYTRTIVTVENTNKLPSNIHGFIHQSQAWQEDNINFENFYIEKSSPESIKITLTNTSNTYTLRLAGGINYGYLVIRRFRKYDDRFFQKFNERFRSDFLEKGYIFNVIKDNKFIFIIEKQLKIKLEFGAMIPSRGTFYSAGLDLYANEEGTIKAGERKLISTGVSCEFPLNTYGRIAPRSSLSMKGIDVGAGVIDSDYTGIIKVLLINNGKENFLINIGDKISQLILEEYRHVIPYLAEISKTQRGSQGFGSTGK